MREIREFFKPTEPNIERNLLYSYFWVGLKIHESQNNNIPFCTHISE